MSRVAVAVGDRRIAPWHVMLAAGPVVIGAYYWVLQLGDAWSHVQMALFVSANAALTTACVVTARRHRRMRWPLLLLGAGALADAAGDVSFYILSIAYGEAPVPNVSDIAYLVDYPLLAAGLLLIVRRRTPGWDIASAIDAAIVAVSAGYLAYEFIIAPSVDTSAGFLANAVSAAYPIGDLMLITVGARLMLGAGPRTVPLRMLGGYLALVLYADTAYAIQELNGTYRDGNYLDAVWMGAAFVLAAGMLHPGVPAMAARSSTVTPDATFGRLTMLAVAAGTAPTSMMIEVLWHRSPHVLVAAAACNVLFFLVLFRMVGLVRAQRLAAITDGLTGLRSRRYFEQALRTEAARAVRSRHPLSMLLLDIDHFKQVNDTFGHDGGDRVLVEVAHRLGQTVRPGDLVARYGGEEFTVLLPSADRSQATEIAERVRRGVGAVPIAVGEGRLHRVTVSVGVAFLPIDTDDASSLVLYADRALYAAKNAGRDRIAVAEEMPAAA
jgi:diguanylate cyclase (GGDEF)-like protein